MKITASTKTLVAALKSQTGIAKPSRTHPILGNIALEAKDKTLTLTAMDLEKRKAVAIPCRTLEEGSITLNCQKLYNYLSTRPEPDCEISVGENHLTTIKVGRSVNNRPGLPLSEMPQWPELSGDVLTLQIPAPLLVDALTKSLAQAAIDDTRGYLKSVMFVSREGKLNIQATNGQRLIIFYTEIPFPKGSQCIIPRESVSSLASLADSGEVEIKLGDNILTASVENAQYSTKLIEANVQDFEKTFPPKGKMATKVILAREDFLREIANAETQTSEESRSIAIECDASEITIKAIGVDTGSVANPMDAKPGSDAISFACNPAYLKDALNAFEEEEVTLRFLDAITPFIIQNDNITAVVYPQRLA